ncbi:MAG TPA: gamma carbonic anhydrase family protein [Candidatus Eisenbacteria bacterium]|nr:gamma carbonic anhydrase family protein [Candidatus Eisenbacteria bacterium]
MNEPARTATIHPTVFIAPGAVVLGDVTLKARSSVWFNTVIRGDSDAVIVGEDTNLQDNSVVHEDEGFPTLIGDRVTVGHRAIIHGCVIEDDCLIGMGSVVLSGARIGKGSLVGASSLVREHQVIPPGSLVVGSPARVLGPTTDQHRAAIRNGSSHYADLARFYMMRGLARGADARGEVTAGALPMSACEWRNLIERMEQEPSAWAGASSDASRLRESSRSMAARDTARLALIEVLVRGTNPPVIDATEPRTTDSTSSAEQANEVWRAARRSLVARLQPLGRSEWIRAIGHPTRGARTLGDWVREWVDQDLERRAALEVAEGSRS